MTTLYETHDRTVPGDSNGYRVSFRYSDAIDGPSEFVFVGSLAAAKAFERAAGAVYVKNFKQVGARRR